MTRAEYVSPVFQVPCGAKGAHVSSVILRRFIHESGVAQLNKCPCVAKTTSYVAVRCSGEVVLNYETYILVILKYLFGTLPTELQAGLVTEESSKNPFCGGHVALHLLLRGQVGAVHRN